MSSEIHKNRKPGDYVALAMRHRGKADEDIGVTLNNYALEEAADDDNVEMVKYFLSNGATKVNGAVDVAFYNGKTAVLQHFIQEIGVVPLSKLNSFLYTAVRRGDMALTKYMVENGANDISGSIIVAAQGQERTLLLYLLNLPQVLDWK